MNDLPDKLFLNLHRLGIMHVLACRSHNVRQRVLQEAHFNTDLISGELSRLDMVTDSRMHKVSRRAVSLAGKGAVEAGFMMLAATFQEFFGYRFVLPVSQGRLAEHLLTGSLAGENAIVPNNVLFVTTRLHHELAGARIEELPVPEAYDLKSEHPFKGNMDLHRLRAALEQDAGRIPYVMMETAVNATGGHPVSMANVRAVHELVQAHGVPLYLDTSRILENAWLIRERENGYGQASLREIVREFCSCSDGCTMSATKDFPADTGGFVATNDEAVFYKCRDRMMMTGDGLSVREKSILNRALGAMRNGDRQIRRRVRLSHTLWQQLARHGVPVVRPAAGHGVFINAEALCRRVGKNAHGPKAFLAELYRRSGILGAENSIGNIQRQNRTVLLRFAVPLDGVTKRDMQYAARRIARLWADNDRIPGLKRTHMPPCRSGEFISHYARLQEKGG